MLEREGWGVVEAENGRVGLELLGRTCPALILLDLMMPEVDGFGFAAEVQRHPQWQQIPIVVVTAKDLTAEDKERLAGHVGSILQKGNYSRDMLSRRLIRKGYKVLIACDGRAGVEMAGLESPDLILMDMSLPELDGWEATSLIKANAATRHIPVIDLTAHAMATDQQKALNAGCDDFDTKPVDLARLVGKMEALLA